MAEAPGGAWVANRLLRRLLKDQAEGQLKDLESYQAEFPDHAALVAREYRAFADKSAPGGVLFFGRYEIVRELGRGGQGVVYEARDPELRRTVALKLLHHGDARLDFLSRFQREREALASLDHPGIATVLDAGEVEEGPFIIMRLVRGRTLRDAAASLSVDEALRVMEEVARAMHVAHQRGFVHRDLKPSNIMVEPSGRPVVLDFGLVSVGASDQPELTLTSHRLGSPPYMAPEQIANAGNVDARCDVWAMGVMLYELLAGSLPFRGASELELFKGITTGTPTSLRTANPRLSRDHEAVVLLALEKDRARRYRTALELAEDLSRLRRREPVQARRPTLLRRAVQWVRRNPVAAAVLLTMVLATAGFAAVRDALRERDAMATAREARVEARALRDEWVRERSSLDLLGDRLQEARRSSRGYAPRSSRANLSNLERDVARQREVVSDRAAGVREALERAHRAESAYFDGRMSKETRLACVEFHMEEFRSAVSRCDGAAKRRARDAVIEYDRERRFRDELQGLGTIDINVEPGDASVHLFRYEPYEAVRADRPVVSRLVPVPTHGVGRTDLSAEELHDLKPGDPCLLVTAVEPGSAAERQGVRPGDFVVRMNGHEVLETLVVGGVVSESPAKEAGVSELDLIQSVNDFRVTSRHAWGLFTYGEERARVDGGIRTSVSRPGEADCDHIFPVTRFRVRVGRTVVVAEGQSLDVTGIVPSEVREVLAGKAPASFSVETVRGDKASTHHFSVGERIGLRTEPVAYPLLKRAANRVHAGTHAVEPGSYLVVAERAGFDTQRAPVLVSRFGAEAICLKLLPAGTTPDGFCFIPPGKFIIGGDERAPESLSESVCDATAFFIARREVTVGEWFRFLNSPGVRENIDLKAAPRESRLLPGSNGGGIWATKGRNGEWRPLFGKPGSPIMGVSLQDARRYVAWLKRISPPDGLPGWHYAIPTEAEWEKAARGADGRAFPWGNRFCDSLGVAGYRTAKLAFQYELPGGFEPRDESPFGVQDMAGSRMEWTETELAPDSRRYVVKGGNWQVLEEYHYRVAGRGGWPDWYRSASLGFRLVIRRSAER